MSEPQTPSETVRVVLLAHEDALAEEIARRVPGKAVCCVRAASGYEAAAELLAGPAGALVVSLRALPRRHLGLPALARRLGVPVVAVGSLPAAASSEDLSGVRLAGEKDIGAILLELPAAGRGVAAAGAQRSRSAADIPSVAPVPQPRGTQQPPPAGRYVPEKAPANDAGAADLLTPDELRALLGDGV